MDCRELTMRTDHLGGYHTVHTRDDNGLEQGNGRGTEEVGKFKAYFKEETTELGDVMDEENGEGEW